MKIKRYKKFQEIKKENKRILFALHLRCAECFGYFDDGYQNCDSTTCPIRQYFPTKQQYNSLVRTDAFIRRRNEAFSRAQKDVQTETEDTKGAKHDS